MGSFPNLKKAITSGKRLQQIAYLYSIRPKSLVNILNNKPVSSYFIIKITKIEAELSQQEDIKEFILCSPNISRLLNVYRLYKLRGTLKKAGIELGLTRERVRQLLKKGTNLGLYRYRKLHGKSIPRISRKRIIACYKETPRMKEVMSTLGISHSQLVNILSKHRLTQKDFTEIRKDFQRGKCNQLYQEFVKEYGRHPTTTVLQRSAKTLSNKITQLWGSIHLFRKELGIQLVNLESP